jgi:hypothetical protein
VGPAGLRRRQAAARADPAGGLAGAPHRDAAVRLAHQVTGLRRFKRAYEEVARKNAKSTLAAGILLYMLTADGEPGAHCYSAATTGEQAREVFDVARNMVSLLPEMQVRFGIEYGKHDITIPATGQQLQAAERRGLHARRPERALRGGRRAARAQDARGVRRARLGDRRARASR